MEEKEARTLNLTKEESSKGEDPRPSQDSQARGSPAGFIPGKGGQRWPIVVYLLLMLTPWYLLCSARGLRKQGFPESSCFPGSFDFSSLRKNTEKSCQCARSCIKSQRHLQFRDPRDEDFLSILQMHPKSCLPQDLCMRCLKFPLSASVAPSFCSFSALPQGHLIPGVLPKHPRVNVILLWNILFFFSSHFMAQKQDNALFKDESLGAKELRMGPLFSSY